MSESDGLVGRMPTNTAGQREKSIVQPLRPSEPSTKVAFLCSVCGRPRSPGSASKCAACYFKPSARKLAKLRVGIAREERERLVYQMRAPLITGIAAASTAADLLGLGPAPAMGKGTHWLSAEDRALTLLVKAEIDHVRAAVALGRSAPALANRARRLGLALPKSWPYFYISKNKEQYRQLQFPYIRTARPEHADLLRVNDIVPKSFPEWQRADICQSIMLALFEGQTTLAELEAHKGKPRYFIKEYYKKQQPWQELLGMSAGDDDNRSYEDVAVANSRTPGDRAVMPTQIEDTFVTQVMAAHKRMNESGRPISMRETIELLEATAQHCRRARVVAYDRHACDVETIEDNDTRLAWPA